MKASGYSNSSGPLRTEPRCSSTRAAASSSRSGGTPMRPNRDGRRRPGPAPHRGLVRLGRGRPEPRGFQELAHVLLVAEGEGADGALPGGRRRGRQEGPQGRADVPRVSLDALPAGEHEAPVRREPTLDGGEGRRRLVEEHDAELADRQVDGPGSSVPVCTSIWRKRTFERPASAARRPANSSKADEMSSPTTSPSGATASARVIASAPPPQPTSKTR